MISEEILDYRDGTLNQLKDNPPMFNSITGTDERTAVDYAAREILELLQNSADAGNKAKIELSGNTLRVSNSGEPFSLEGIKAIMMSSNSTKEKGTKMGCKGIGFRAVLNISDDIAIHSGDAHLRFCTENAFAAKKKYGFSKAPSILLCPEIIKDITPHEEDYVTSIVIKIRDQKQTERIERQLEEIREDTILFLTDNFEFLEVIINGKTDTFTRSRKKLRNNEALISLGHNGTITTYREFRQNGIIDSIDDEKGKRYQISVAYSPRPIENNKLYSYFHTNIDFPMKHWYAHGNFDLESNRNQLAKNGKRDDYIFEQLIKLMCESATKISEKVDYEGYKSLKLTDGRFSSSILAGADANALLDRQIRKTPLLPTIHDSYISIDSEPVYYDNNLQQFLIDMPENNDLLKYTEEQALISCLRYDTYHYDFETVSKYLNDKKDKLSNNERVLCAKLIWDSYKEEDIFQEIAPNFFVDEKGKEIENGQIVIKTPKLAEMTLPAFLKQRYLCQEQLNKIKASLDVSLDENLVLTSFAESYGFEIANIDGLLDKLNSLVKDCHHKIPEYVRWIFDNRKIIEESDSDFYLLAKDGTIRKSNDLYFGKDYIEDTQLERFFESSRIVAGPEEFGINTDEVETFSELLKRKLKVIDYPRNTDGGIDGLESILEIADTEFILRLLFNKREYLNSHASSETKELLKNKKWVQRDKKRYAPKDIVIVPNTNIYRKISDRIVADFLIISKDDFLSGIKVEDFESSWLIRTFLTIKTNINQLDYEYLYQILNNLPTFDRKGKISENIYKDIIDIKDRSLPDNSCIEFNKYRKNGRVFCKDNEFHGINDCLYLESDYPKAIRAGYNYIDITKNKDIETIQHYFGVAPLLVDYELDSFQESSLNNKDFENELINLKTFLLVTNSDFFDNEEKINNLRDIAITLCENISIIFNNKTGQLSDYEYIEDNEIFYIKVPTVKLSTVKGNRNYQNTISDIIRTVFRSQQINRGEVARSASFSIDARADIIKEDYCNNEWLEALEKIAPTIIDGDDYSEKNLSDLYELKDDYSGEYAKRIYSIKYNSSNEDRKTLLSTIEEYNDYIFDQEDVPTGQNADLLKYLYAIFPVLSEEIVSCGDMEKTFKESFDRIISEFPNNQEEVNNVLMNSGLKSLLYFGALSEVREAVRGLIEHNEKYKLQQKQKNELAENLQKNVIDNSAPNTNNRLSESNSDFTHESSLTAENSSSTKNDEDLYVSLPHDNRNIATRLEKPNSSASFEIDSFDEDNLKTLLSRGAPIMSYEDIPSRIVTDGPIKTIHITSTQERKNNEVKRERRAKISEQYAIAELEKQGYETEWVSAYARDEGVNPKGGDGYGYDIIARKDGKVRYVEVKSTTATTGIEFTMTRNEFEQCRRHKNNYDIAYVFSTKNIDNNMPPKMLFLSNVFYNINASNTTPESCKIRLK